MEVSALRYSGAVGLHGRSPLLRLQSDERLIALVRRGNSVAFEVLVARYHSRLLAFCRHLLGSREDAEDILQEVFAAAFNAILADERPINVRPWLYRIARNRSLNHLRRIQAIGVDSMDVHLSENGASTADKVHDREQFRLLVGDIHGLPETQRTALVLREMDALSYEQIAEAMDTTVPGVKSLLVRARISLAEAAEARTLTCEDVRVELAEIAEGLQKRPGPLVRRHLRTCRRCSSFQGQLKRTNKALAALLPIGPVGLLRKLALIHLTHGAGTGSSATAAAGASTAGAGAGASGATGAAAVAGTAGGGAALGGTGGLVSAGAGALATKAAGALAAAAIVTAGAVEASHTVHHHHHAVPIVAAAQPVEQVSGGAAVVGPPAAPAPDQHLATKTAKQPVKTKPPAAKAADKTTAAAKPDPTRRIDTKKGLADTTGKTSPSGRVATQTDSTVLASPSGSADSGTSGGAAPTIAAGTTTTPASSNDATTGTTGATGPTSAIPAPTGTPAPTGATPSPTATPGPTGTTRDPSGTTPDPSGTTPGTSGTTPDSSGGGSPGPTGTTGPSGATDSPPADVVAVAGTVSILPLP